MTIKIRLILLVLFLTLIGATNGLLGLYGMGNSVSGLATVYNDRVVPLRDLKQIADAYAVNIVDTAHKVRNGNMTPAQGVKSVEQAEMTIGAKWKAYLSTVLVDEEKRLVADLKPLLANSNAATARLKNLMASEDMAGIANFTVNELYPSIDPVSDTFAKLIEVQLTVAKQEHDSHQAEYGNLKILSISILAVGSAIGLLISIGMIQRSVVVPLARAGEAIEAIAHGDLTRPLPPASADEVGTIVAKIAAMQSGLRELVEGIRSSVETVGVSSNQLAVTAASSAQVGQEQSDAASGMAASVEQLSVSIDQVDEHAREAREVTNASSIQLDESGRIIDQAATGIRGIADAVNATAGSIHEVESLSGQISSIVGVIRDIADQTNLLALNAAIEAARAGEQGRGFAVVADEVRKLAERTTSSTQEIASMIDKIQQGAQRAVAEMESGVSQVNQGVELAQKAGDSVGGIRSAGARVMQAVDGIGLAIREQAAAARDIARKVDLIARDAEKNSVAFTQTATSAGQLELLAHGLESMASRFKL